MNTEPPATATRCKNAVPILLLGVLPWPAVYVGLYELHNAWAAFALYHSVCLLCWRFARRDLPLQTDPIVRRVNWRALVISSLAINVFVYFVAGFVSALLDPPHLDSALRHLHAIGSVERDIALFLYFGIVNPIAEELFWRGTIYSGLRQAALPVGKSAVISGAFFGAWHWLVCSLLFTPTIAILAVVGICLSGVSLASVYERTRHIGNAMLSHALAADVPLLLVVWVVVLRH